MRCYEAYWSRVRTGHILLKSRCTHQYLVAILSSVIFFVTCLENGALQDFSPVVQNPIIYSLALRSLTIVAPHGLV